MGKVGNFLLKAGADAGCAPATEACGSITGEGVSDV